MARVTKPLRQVIAANLREARIRAGFESISEAARHIGIPVPSAVAHEGSGASFRRPKLEMLRLYAQAYHTTIDALEYGGEPIAASPRRKATVATRDLPEIMRLESVPILGTAQAGHWTEVDPIRDTAERTPAKRGPVPQFAVHVAGDSMNRIMHDGDIAIIRPWAAMNSDPVNGEVILVQRESNGRYEMSIKTFRDGKLYADSVNPKWFNKTLPMRDGDTVTVIGKVVGIYRSL